MITHNFHPPQCNTEIYKSGICIGVIHSYPSPQIEAFVKYAAELSGEKIDWHFAGGRGRILVLGDEQACKNATSAFHMLRLDPQKTDLVKSYGETSP